MEYQRYAETYGYEDVSVAIPPALPDNIKQHVFVTHDESTFYANDHQQYAWLESTEFHNAQITREIHYDLRIPMPVPWNNESGYRRQGDDFQSGILPTIYKKKAACKW
ncbi:hypothetical protein HPULCUR_001432 [Helicostylum pulchrum]|uniref:Uncharacterized protein n=1 Tax=Helicostylum pulchrum TaxID=562976 RepID=A0ABP9XMP7_9FUNG